MKIKYTIILLLLYFLLPAAEKFALLPTVSAPAYKKQRLEFRSYLKKIIDDNAQFKTISDQVLVQNFKGFDLKKPRNDNDYLLRSGLIAGAAKICYSEIVARQGKIFLYIKIFDCQENDLFMIEKFEINNNLDIIVSRIYQRIKENYFSRSQYLTILKKLRLNKQQLNGIENNGGTIKGYAMLTPYKIKVDTYIHILLMAGSAAEFADFLEIGYTSAYYIKYLSYIYNLPLF